MAVLLGYSNKVDDSTLSGGAWAAAYPRSNIQTRELHRQARSTSTSATVTVTLPASQLIGVVGVVGNLTAAATITVTAGAYNSGAVNAVAVAPNVTASAVTIVISDSGNPDGYVAIGRVFVGAAFNPATCVDWGLAYGIEDTTEVAVALAGPEYFAKKPTRRVWSGRWSWLTSTEAYTVLYEIQRQTGISDEVFLIDTTSPPAPKFLGRFRTLSPIEFPYPATHACGVEISELL